MINNWCSKMIVNKKCIPLGLARCAPVYSGEKKNESEMTDGWFVQVDFAGIGVPNMFVLGGRVYEYNVEAAPSLYSGKYPFVTRVEYRFKNGLLFNAHKNVCRFNTNIAKRIKKYNPQIKTEQDLWVLNSVLCPQLVAARANENIK